jgi:hypothetical protein
MSSGDQDARLTPGHVGVVVDEEHVTGDVL